MTDDKMFRYKIESFVVDTNSSIENDLSILKDGAPTGRETPEAIFEYTQTLAHLNGRSEVIKKLSTLVFEQTPFEAPKE